MKKIIRLRFIFLYRTFCLEFDIWYNECYLNGIAPSTSQDDSLPSAKTNSEYQFYDDAAERFERMQKELLLSNLDSMPFRQAQMRTNRRVRQKSHVRCFIVDVFLFSFQHVFNAATTQGSWKNAPAATVTMHTDLPSSASSRQGPPLLPAIRQKTLVG